MRAVLTLFVALFIAIGSLASHASGPQAAPAAQAAPAQAATEAAETPSGSKIWIGREAEIEEYLKTAKVAKLENIPIGVTKPRRAAFEPGGPVASAAWKTLQPNRESGYFESYKSEIAAYELDKIMKLGMVPPTVERKIEGQTGSAQMWIEKTAWLRDRDPSKAPDMARWNRQVFRQRVWDNLTGNIDRNQGNLLVDDAWNLFLIDHSRAFTATTAMPFEKQMTRIDRPFFEALKALNEPELKAKLGKLLIDGPKPLLKRRDRIVKHYEELIAKNGEAGVLTP